jgi:uncharacterized membrane protein
MKQDGVRNEKAETPAETHEPVNPWLKPEWVFAVLALAAGGFMVFATAPFQAPDETGHFFRAFQISQGQFIAERKGRLVGGVLPVSVQNATKVFSDIQFHPYVKADKKEVARLLKEPFADNPTWFYDSIHIALYSPMAYVAPAIGVLVGRYAGLSALGMMYAARLASLLCWVGLVLAAIRLTPVFKWVMVMIGLIPMGIFLGASVTADSPTNGLSMLLTALILRSSFGKDGPVKWSEGIWIVLVCICLGLTKQVYFILAALALMIPVSRFRGWWSKLAFVCIALGAGAAAAMIWAYAIRAVVVMETWVSPGQQLSFILWHPIQYLHVLIQTAQVRGPIVLRSFVGILGWIDTPLPAFVYPTYTIMLIGAALTDQKRELKMGLYAKALIACVCVAMIWLVVASQYLLWTPLQYPVIGGLQGRYFIPLGVPIFLVLYNRRIRLTENWLSIAVTCFCTVVMIATCLTVLHRYYE